MDVAETDRNLIDPAWRRWTLLGLLITLGLIYIFAYALFVAHSENFIVVQRNERAENFSRAHVVSAPAKLSFGVGEPDNPRLGGGWHAPDSGGAWSQTADAFIEIVVPRKHAPLMLRVNTTAAVLKQRPKMRIKAFVNGAPAGRWARYNSNASEAFDVRVPASIADSGRLEICLRVDHTTSPFRFGAGPDSRQLGILLHSIELLDAGASH